jgi:hypothetical protein
MPDKTSCFFRVDGKILVFLTCFLLLSSMFFFVPLHVSAGATDTYSLNLQLTGRNVVFLGESVTIQTQSNSSTVFLSISNPSGASVYSNIVLGNSSTSFKLTENYGKYTVKATVSDSITETWFWFQDSTGLSSSASKIDYSFQKVNYVINEVSVAGKISTYTLKSTFENKSFEVEWLSEVFTKLKPTTVSIQRNSAGLTKISTYGDKNKIDSWIMNTCFGLKIRVNGTLDAVTSFKWNFVNINTQVVWQPNGFRLEGESRNLIFDHSDMMSSASIGTSSALDKTGLKLDVILQKTFDLDPVIFSDGFESGDFTAWTGSTGAKITVESLHPHHGTYNANVTGSAAEDWSYAYQTISSSAITYARCYVKFANLNIPSGKNLQILGLDYGSYQYNLVASVKNDSGTLKWFLSIGEASNWAGSVLGTHTPALDTWYCVEIERNVTNDIETLYVDGVAEASASVAITENTTRMYAGVYQDGIGDNELYIDCVVTDSVYIGPEVASDTTAPTYSSLSSSSTIAGASCQFNSTWTDETGLATTGGYIIEHNNTGTLTNSSWTAFASNPNTTSTTITLNSTVGNVVQWQVYANDTSNNWNSTGLQNITLTDGSAPTYGAIVADSLVAGAEVYLSCNLTDNVANHYFIFSWNNTGVWQNKTASQPTPTSDPNSLASYTDFWNTTTGVTVSAKFYSNDTSNNWGVSSQYNFSLTDGTVPSFTSITSSSTLAGSSSTLSVNITDDVAVSFLIWSTNINGTWINGTTTAFSSNPVTKALVLPSGIGSAFYVKVYANDTANNWVVSTQANFTTTAVYVSLQARDKDGLNLPRAVTFSGTLPNGTAYSVTSSAAGLYSLQCSNGSLTVAVTWQTHLVKTSTTIAVSANASSNLNTNIARLNYTSSQYVLVSINGTTLNTPSYTVLSGWKIDNIGGTGQKPLIVDQANWVKTSNPLAVKVAGNSYDSLNWVYASNILSSLNVDFVAYNEPTVELVYEVSSGDVDGSGVGSSPTATSTPSGSPLGANDFQISDVSLGIIQPNSTMTATLHLRYSGSSYTYQNIVLSEPFNSWLIQDSLSLRSYILSNPTESSVDVTLTFMIPAGISVQVYSGEISFTALDAFGASHTSTAVISASVEGASVKFDAANWVRGNLWIVAIAVVAVLAVLGFIATKTRRR